MINFEDYTNENKTKHSLNWPYIPDHPYRILIIGGSRSKNIQMIWMMLVKILMDITLKKKIKY